MIIRMHFMHSSQTMKPVTVSNCQKNTDDIDTSEKRNIYNRIIQMYNLTTLTKFFK